MIWNMNLTCGNIDSSVAQENLSFSSLHELCGSVICFQFSLYSTSSIIRTPRNQIFRKVFGLSKVWVIENDVKPERILI